MSSAAEEEARAARVLHYKEERRRQLRARAQAAENDKRNGMPERSTKRLPTFRDRSSNSKSSSELNLRSKVVGGSVIRATKASKLPSGLSGDVPQPSSSHLMMASASVHETRRNEDTEKLTEQQNVGKSIGGSSEDVAKRLNENNRASRLVKNQPTTSSAKETRLFNTQKVEIKKVMDKKIVKEQISGSYVSKKLDGKDTTNRLVQKRSTKSTERESRLFKTQKEETKKMTEEQKVRVKSGSSVNIPNKLQGNDRASWLVHNETITSSGRQTRAQEKQSENVTTEEQNFRRRIAGSSGNVSKKLVNGNDNRGSRISTNERKISSVEVKSKAPSRKIEANLEDRRKCRSQIKGAVSVEKFNDDAIRLLECSTAVENTVESSFPYVNDDISSEVIGHDILESGPPLGFVPVHRFSELLSSSVLAINTDSFFESVLVESPVSKKLVNGKDNRASRISTDKRNTSSVEIKSKALSRKIKANLEDRRKSRGQIKGAVSVEKFNDDVIRLRECSTPVENTVEPSFPYVNDHISSEVIGHDILESGPPLGFVPVHRFSELLSSSVLPINPDSFFESVLVESPVSKKLDNEKENRASRISTDERKTSSVEIKSKALSRKIKANLEDRKKSRGQRKGAVSVEKLNDDDIRLLECSTPVENTVEPSFPHVNGDISFKVMGHDILESGPPLGFVPVHRFSELLSSSILTTVENGIDTDAVQYSIERAAAATGGCRRASRLESPVEVAAADSPTARGRRPPVSAPSNAAPTFTERRAMERRPLQGSAQDSKSRRRAAGGTVIRADVVSSSSSSPQSSSATNSPRATLSGKESSPSSNSGAGSSSSNSPSSMITSSPKIKSHKKNTESGKAILIPLCRRSVEREQKAVDQCRGPVTPKDRRDSPHGLSTKKSSPIFKSDTDGRDNKTKIKYARDGIDNLKKRLTNVDIADHKTNPCRNLSRRKLNGSAATANEIDINHKKMVNTNVTKASNETKTIAQSLPRKDMKTHTNTNRLSHRIDNLAALNKETLARINKLNNNKLRLEPVNYNGKPNMFSSSLEETNDNSNTFSQLMEPSATNEELVQATNSAMQARGVSERLQDIDTAAQHLRDFGKIATFCDSSGHKRFNESSSSVLAQIPVSILKRKSIQDDHVLGVSVCPTGTLPVTFSPNVVDPTSTRSGKQTQGILKKRRSLDESQVSRNRSCSPEVSFASDSNEPGDSRPLLKSLRRSSLEDVVRNQSPDSNIQGILKRKLSREEEHLSEDRSLGSPEPQGILKRKSNSSSSSSTTSSHVSIAQAVLLAAAGEAEIVLEDKDGVRPILKKKSFSEERPSPEVIHTDVPRPILKKKSLTDPEDHDQDRPKKTILKMSRKLSNEDGNTSSFDLSEDDPSSRRPPIRSRTSDHSGSECEGSVKPILKQSISSHSRERSQSPRPRLSFSADVEASALSVADELLNSNSVNESGIRTGLVLNSTELDISGVCSSDAEKRISQSPPKLRIPSEEVTNNILPSAVLRRRNLRPKNSSRSKSQACDFDEELFSILNQRRQKVEDAVDGAVAWPRGDSTSLEGDPIVATVPFVPIAMRIRNMEKFFAKERVSVNGKQPGDSEGVRTKKQSRDRERYRTQPVTVEEMRSITSLDVGQTNFQPYGLIETGSFPSRFAGETCAVRNRAADEAVSAALDGALRRVVEVASAPAESESDSAEWSRVCCDSLVSWCDPPASVSGDFAERSSGELLAEVEAAQEAVARALRTLDVPPEAPALDPYQAPCLAHDADAWSVDVSHDSGVFNKADSRDSGPSSAEELAAPAVTETMSTQDGSHEESDEVETENCRFPTGLARSNSVKARASLWQHLQQQAKGVPRPLLRHSRSKSRDFPELEDRLRPKVDTETVSLEPAHLPTLHPLAPSASAANLQHDEDAKLDEDDPAKMSLLEKMSMFQARLTHKPPSSSILRPADRSRANRLATMPVLASDVQEAIEAQNRLSKSVSDADDIRDPDFHKKMQLFRSASLKNAPLALINEKDSKNNNLGYRRDRHLGHPAERILKSGSGPVATASESSEGLKDEGIDSSSEDESDSVSTCSSSDKSCTTDSSDAPPPPGPQQEEPAAPHLLKSSRTDSDLTKILRVNYVDRARNMLPLVNQQPRLGSKITEQTFPKRSVIATHLASQNRTVPTDSEKENVSDDPKVRSGMESAKKRFLRKLEEDLSKSKPPAAGLLRPRFGPSRTAEGREGREGGGSGSDGESSGGREVRHINTRRRNLRTGSAMGGATGAAPLARSATHGALPTHALRGGTIAERLAALQQNGNNEWRKRVEPLGADAAAASAAAVRLDAANRKNDSLNQRAGAEDIMSAAAVDAGVVADRRDRLEVARNGWRRRVGVKDAALYSVAGRMEKEGAPATRDRVQIVPPASPGVPSPNNFRSRRAVPAAVLPAPGPLRSASCAVMGGSPSAFRRSQSAGADAAEPLAPEAGAGERTAKAVAVPRADDETFAAFYERSATTVVDSTTPAPLVADLDAIDGGNTHLLSSQAAGRARVAGRRRAASRNPLRALAARDDLCSEYTQLEPAATAAHKPAHDAKRAHVEKVCGKTGLAAEALAALASREDFAAVALRSAATSQAPSSAHAPHQDVMLLQVKGRRRVQTRLVAPVHTSVNCGDCFVLVTPDEVFHYVGQYANVIERSRGTDIALNIHNTKDLGCKNSTAVTTIDELARNYSGKGWNKFWSLLGVQDQDLDNFQPAQAGHSDEDEIYESGIIHTNMCYELCDDELVPIKEYWGQVPKISMLNLSKIIVFDFGSELYVWNGKNASLEKRRLAAQLAKELFDEGYNYENCHVCPIDVAQTVGARDEKIESSKVGDERPEWAILAKVTQHMETVLFREKFLDWPDFTRVIKVKEETEEKSGRSNSAEIAPCDAEEMLANEYQDPNLVLEGTSLGRGTRYYDKESMRHFEIKTKSVSKWIVHEYDYQRIEDEKEIGEFYSGDSYIIRWEYQVTATGRELNGKPSKHNLTGRDRCAYFCWQGKDASPNEKGTAALLTVELDKERGPQVRVTQGNEPPAFLNLFQGNLIVHQGKKDTDKSRYKLYMTRGNVVNEAYLLQVPCSMRQLRSRASMLLIDTSRGLVYIWHGARSMKHTKNVTIALANRLTTLKSPEIFGTKANTITVTEVNEGSEPPAVSEALGGANRQLYFSLMNESESSPAEVSPRMFHLSDVSRSGHLEASEVLSPLRHEHHVTPYPFEQKELYDASQPGLFLVDDGRTVWLWQGWRPRRRHDDDTDDQQEDGAFTGGWRRLRLAGLRVARQFARGRPALVVAAGLEPLPFANLFPVWQDRDDIAEINMAHGWMAGEARVAEREESRVSGGALLLPVALLRQRPLPDAVDPAHIEAHLSPEDFQEAFGVSKEEFSELPAWKQANMKKELGLF